MSQRMTTSKTPALQLLGSGGIDEYSTGKPEIFVPSGLQALDKLILGAVNTELILVAGRPGEGKTALAMQWAEREAGSGGMAAVLSLEMSRRALRNRMIATLTGIPMQMLRTRDWASDKHRQKAVEAAQYLSELPLYVDDRSGLDAQAVYDTLTGWGQQGVTLAIIDYVQRMGGEGESRNQQVGDAVRAIKSAAKDGGIPIVAISSLNRKSDGGKPSMSWLRESGDLEFEADTVLMFHYPEDDEYEDVRMCDIHVVKQRNGPTGVASVQFNKPSTKFEDIK